MLDNVEDIERCLVAAIERLQENILDEGCRIPVDKRCRISVDILDIMSTDIRQRQQEKIVKLPTNASEYQ